MAEPLKNSYGPEIPEYIAGLIGVVVPRFPRKRFLVACLDGYEDLELMSRAQRISNVLAEVLPTDREAALQIIIDAFDAEGGPQDLQGMEGFRYLPLGDFIGDHGLEHHELSMVALRELTIRFTSEFAIRPFLEHHPAATLAQCREWTVHDSEHVRRLVSEGTRPRLPWGSRLRAFMADPSPVIELLELLKDDTSEYVRRSVANNVNDIAKDHPDVVVDIADRWWPGASTDRRRLVKHALRTLIKQGNPDALAVIGYGPDSPLVVSAFSCSPEIAAIGEKTQVSVDLHNPTDEVCSALVDFRVHFVKANGSASPKVFKGAEIDVGPGATAAVKKTISLKVHTTRTPYVGTHEVKVLINGDAFPVGSFEVTAEMPTT